MPPAPGDALTKSQLQAARAPGLREQTEVLGLQTDNELLRAELLRMRRLLDKKDQLLEETERELRQQLEERDGRIRELEALGRAAGRGGPDAADCRSQVEQLQEQVRDMKQSQIKVLVFTI